MHGILAAACPVDWDGVISIEKAWFKSLLYYLILFNALFTLNYFVFLRENDSFKTEIFQICFCL